jgi:hypothetical protein
LNYFTIPFLGGGIPAIVQCGHTGVSAAAFVDVTFPAPFPTACDAPVCMTTLPGQKATVSNVTTTGCRFSWQSALSGVVFWFAIGR